MSFRDKRGFTLLEMLIVVAIISVLIAMAIPVFTGQLEKSREAVDLANVRSAYSRVYIAALTEDTTGLASEAGGGYYEDVELKQASDDWQTQLPVTIGNVSSDDDNWVGSPRSGGKCRVRWLDGEMRLFWNGSTLGGVNGIATPKNTYWWQDPNSEPGSIMIYQGDGQKEKQRIGVSPVTLKEGDSFTVPKNCLVPDDTDNKHSIVAFYLAEEVSDGGKYRGILDSGWLKESDATKFTPATNGYLVTNYDEYYKVSYSDGGITFTVTNPNGLVLLVNNRLDGSIDTALNNVYINN